MKNNSSTQTLTASYALDAELLFARLSDPEQLPAWHPSFCRALRKQDGVYFVESPRGSVPVRLLRNDHSMVFDLFSEITEGIELQNAIRVLRNGEGAEIIWTLVKPEGIEDAAFEEQVKWAEESLQAIGEAFSRSRQKSMDYRAAKPPHSNPDEIQSRPESIAESAPSGTDQVDLPPSSGKRLFVGNLSYAWTDEDLRGHFSGQGSVTTAEIARFRGRGGRSRGFGFVEMASEEEAQSAIAQLHEREAGGRQIIVRLAKSQESRADKPKAAAGMESSLEAPEPGNERHPARHAQRSTSRAPRRSRRPIRSGRGGPQDGNRSYQVTDITNKSGYEIFPRRSSGFSNTGSRHQAPEPSDRRIESSPYMDDTGDFENRGRRPPHRRRR